jgi:hypothetical protein
MRLGQIHAAYRVVVFKDGGRLSLCKAHYFGAIAFEVVNVDGSLRKRWTMVGSYRPVGRVVEAGPGDVCFDCMFPIEYSWMKKA